MMWGISKKQWLIAWVVTSLAGMLVYSIDKDFGWDSWIIWAVNMVTAAGFVFSMDSPNVVLVTRCNECKQELRVRFGEKVTCSCGLNTVIFQKGKH